MIIQVIIGLFVSYVLLFILSILLKDNSIADVFWGLGFLQLAVHASILSGTVTLLQVALLGLIVLWSLRIFLYILSKKLAKKGEDPRYAAWRKEWKYVYLRSFFQVYMLQGALLLVIAAPIFIINWLPIATPAIIIAGSAISLFGLTYETIGDLQLKKFVKTKKKGQIMTKGLWKYSRHPNYFGESVFWFGISLLAAQVSVFSFISWATITLLLRFVSGVPKAEERYDDNKEFQAYKKSTPPMFPSIKKFFN